MTSAVEAALLRQHIDWLEATVRELRGRVEEDKQARLRLADEIAALGSRLQAMANELRRMV